MVGNGFNGSNPFASLNKSQFPSKDDRRPKGDNHPKKPSKPVKQAEPSVATRNDDADLFLDAVRFIKPLSKENSRLAKKESRQAPSIPEVKAVSEMKTQAPPAGPSQLPSMPSATVGTSPQSTQPASREPQPDEEIVFASAMRDVQRLEGKGRAVLPEVSPAPSPLAPLPEDENAWTFAVNSHGGYVEGHLLGLDLMLVGKLQAGQVKPAGHLDLHGLTAQQAFHSLVHFVRSAYTKDQRAVLIVSGRGRNSPAGLGVLRDKLQEWLVQEPLRRVVLAFCSAAPADGGYGALYVLLRRYRRDGRQIYWDRHPADPDLIWGTEPS